MYAFLFFLAFIPFFALVGVYIERKISAFIQDRLGPTEVGKFGLLQTFADIIKLIQKEDIVPEKVDKKLFKIAPSIIYMAVFAGFASIPLNPNLIGSGIAIGVFYLLAIISIDVVAILMAGWSSNSKYALFGAMRSIAQIVSYEIPLGLAVLSVVMISQSLDLQAISYQQGIWLNEYQGQEKEVNYLFGISGLGWEITDIGGLLTWNIFRVPILFFAFIIFFIASLAECNRAPFDLPEAESELIAGFQTEYSGFRWALIMLAEYGMMLLMALLGAILFLGSWNTPFPNIGSFALADWTSGSLGTWTSSVWGTFWLFLKTFILVFLQMWIRWTYPRLRVDQLMYLSWKVLTPFALGIVLLAGIWRLLMV